MSAALLAAALSFVAPDGLERWLHVELSASSTVGLELGARVLSSSVAARRHRLGPFAVPAEGRAEAVLRLAGGGRHVLSLPGGRDARVRLVVLASAAPGDGLAGALLEVAADPPPDAVLELGPTIAADPELESPVAPGAGHGGPSLLVPVFGRLPAGLGAEPLRDPLRERHGAPITALRRRLGPAWLVRLDGRASLAEASPQRRFLDAAVLEAGAAPVVLAVAGRGCPTAEAEAVSLAPGRGPLALVICGPGVAYERALAGATLVGLGASLAGTGGAPSSAALRAWARVQGALRLELEGPRWRAELVGPLGGILDRSEGPTPPSSAPGAPRRLWALGLGALALALAVLRVARAVVRGGVERWP